MLSIFKRLTCGRLLATGVVLITVAAPAQASIDIGLVGGPDGSSICLGANSPGIVTGNTDTCDSIHTDPPYLRIGNATNYVNFDAADGASTFNTQATFNAGVSMTGSLNVSAVTTFTDTVSLQGPSVTVASPTTFTFGTTFQNVTTFNGLADFNGSVTSSSITNSGTIGTNILDAGRVEAERVEIADSIFFSTGANITMGNNIVHSVAAGVVDTDAVNVGQLNAAVAGVATDVTALETNVTTLQTDVTTLESDLASETAARVAADTALDTRVDALETITANLDERFDDVQDRSDAGTAAAVALSGAMFLPGKSFNLTGNVGAYRGAVAGAIQFGALVSDRVAINAGVAHGFNKGGKSALRAGFSLGF